MASAKAIPESKALPARDAAIRDENDWPEYHMRNVEVTDRHGRPVSLLQAEDAFPVTVTGMLDLGKAQEKVCESCHAWADWLAGGQLSRTNGPAL